MIIPKLHYISQGDSPKEHVENIQKACTSGAELVQLRLENVSEKKHLKIAKEVLKITTHYQTRLIIFEDYKLAKEIKADGVFLEKSNTCPTLVRKNLFSWQSIGTKAYNLEDCEIQIEKEVDYIILSPFKSKKDNPSNMALGINGFSLITEALKNETPLIACGGITTEDIPAILKSGISGAAVSKAITENFDSIRTFNQLLKASSTDEIRHTFTS